MRIFLDTANIADVQHWLDQGVIDGVTTNPSIIRSTGRADMEAVARELVSLLKGRPLSVEVVTDDPEVMLAQAEAMASWDPSIVVKIPVIASNGASSLEVVNRLAKMGIPTNVTACLSAGQALLAAKAGARYVSLFAGRIDDEGGDSAATIRRVAALIPAISPTAEIIAGSLRTVGMVLDALAAGAHVVTIPPKLLGTLLDHKYSRHTVKQFLDDGLAALDQGRAAVRPEQ